jgi:PAS domain S-box-containing protein
MISDSFQLAGTVRARLESVQRRGSYLLMAFGVIILTLMVSVIVSSSNSVVARITNLHKGAEIIAAGDFGYQVDVGSRDEIGSLAHAFNEMTRQLRESYEALKEEITERKCAEETLRESEEKFRQFFENEPDYCYMISLDGRILDINYSALTALGYKKEEIVGKELVKTIYAPSSTESAKELLKEWKKTGKLRNEEIKIITKSGEEKTVLLSADSVKGLDGKLLHSLSVQRDITERKRTEEELEQHREHLEELVRERTTELQKMVNLMAGREVRMAELKNSIKKLRTQLEEAGMTPVADDPLKEI